MDREKVIKGLECHRIDNKHRINCADCPYYVDDDNHINCVNDLHADVLALLKEQDKRINMKQRRIDQLCKQLTDLKHRFHEKTELVRCKDCEDACICSDDWVICTHIDSNGNDKHSVDWYCADGERRTE